MVTGPRISFVIVSWNSVGELGRTLPALVPQLREDDELIVADNGSEDGTPGLIAELAPDARVVPMGGNRGFSAAVNEGAKEAAGDLLVVLNPDAVPQPGFREAIVAPMSGRRWGAWMPLVTAKGGSEVNTAGNPVHFTGFSWAGRHGSAPASVEPGEVPTISGACLAIPLERFRAAGELPDSFFLYHEDTDLSLRLRLEGERLGIEPTAVVDHEYEFAGEGKMHWLERNRWAVVLRTYPGPLLLLVAPALLLTELALVPISIAGGWGRQKLLANLDGLARLPSNLRSRRSIQARRTVSAAEFADLLTPDLDSPFFGGAGRSTLLRWALRAYWRLVRAALGRR